MEYSRIPNHFENEKESIKKANDMLIKIFENKNPSIDTIKSIISEFHKYENQNSIEIFNKIERNINESDVSVNKIGDIIKNTDNIINSTHEFLKAWEKITAPLNYYGKKLENLMVSKKNVSSVRHNLSTYVKIKDQINELRNLLNSNDSNVVIVYKQIRYLTFLRVILLEKVKSVDMIDKLNNLADHLLCVAHFEEEFFEKFWKYFQDILKLALERPEFLVKLLRLIEEDPEYVRNIKIHFQMYNKSEDKFSGIDSRRNSLKESKISITGDRQENDFDNLSEILIYKIEEFINEKFHLAFYDKEELQDILFETINFVNDLQIVYIKVAPCFPPKYNIFNIYKDKYLEYISEKMKPFIDEKKLEQNPGNLILIARWLDKFADGLKKVGIDIKSTDIGCEIEFYMHLFYDHVNDKLQENITSIIAKNVEDKEIIKNTKNLDLEKIQSFYASDIFRSLFNVIELLSGDIKGQLLYQIIKIVVDKLQEIQKLNENYLLALNKPDELIVSCVYVLDANNCIEIFPDFKKKIKNILQKEFYDRLKVYYRNATSLFNNTIRVGCLKSIELMFIELESKFLCKIFTTEWNEDILGGIFESFKSYFNRCFVKTLKHQHILIIIVRSFIDNFVNFYQEELIHSLRSLNRKKLGESPLTEYKLKFLKLSAEDIKYEVKKEEKLDHLDSHTATNKATQLIKSPNVAKKLDKYDVYNTHKKDEIVKFKKYDFPVKKFNKESKQYTTAVVFKKVVEDMKLFKDFMEGFKEEAKEPFSKKLTLSLGNNYVDLYVRKFVAIKDILNCTQKSIPDTIKLVFKDSYSGPEGKALLEALLYAREDHKATTKADLKKYYLNTYDNDNNA